MVLRPLDGLRGSTGQGTATGDRFRQAQEELSSSKHSLRVQIRLTGSQSSIGKLGKGVKPQVKERQGDL